MRDWKCQSCLQEDHLALLSRQRSSILTLGTNKRDLPWDMVWRRVLGYKTVEHSPQSEATVDLPQISEALRTLDGMSYQLSASTPLIFEAARHIILVFHTDTIRYLSALIDERAACIKSIAYLTVDSL